MLLDVGVEQKTIQDLRKHAAEEGEGGLLLEKNDK